MKIYENGENVIFQPQSLADIFTLGKMSVFVDVEYTDGDKCDEFSNQAVEIRKRDVLLRLSTKGDK